MVVGVAKVTLQLPGGATLKDKRRVLRSVVARVRSRFNVAVAEVGTLDAAETATLGLVCVSNEAGHAHAMLETVVRAIDEERLDAVLADYSIELV